MADDHGPRELDLDTPNVARLYDSYLGGSHSLSQDRGVAKEFDRIAPHWPLGARLNRRFLGQAVRFMAEQGIDQFLDLGSGVPTTGNVHEVARAVNPQARVLYVDYEPVAYHATQELVADDPNAAILHADLRQPEAVLDAPETRRLIDPDRPLGLILVGVLLFFDDSDRPGEVVETYKRRLVPGSYLAMTATSDDCPDPEIRAELDRVLAEYHRVNERLTFRRRDEIAGWFAGTELVAPGLVNYPYWNTREIDSLSAEQRRCEYGYVGVGKVV